MNIIIIIFCSIAYLVTGFIIGLEHGASSDGKCFLAFLWPIWILIKIIRGLKKCLTNQIY